MEPMFLLLTLLIVKHLIVDFFWQPKYEWANKGTYGHFGGIRHTGKHVIVSAFILMFFVPALPLLLLCLSEAIIHYHMDWWKMWWGARKKYDPYNPKFWHWMGIDQFVHTMTYVGMVLVLS